MVAATDPTRWGGAHRSSLGRSKGPLSYFAMLMTVRSVVSPKRVVWTMTVHETWPVVAPFGIVVDQLAEPSPAVEIRFDVTAGTPGAASVNVTRAPSSGRP